MKMTSTTCNDTASHVLTWENLGEWVEHEFKPYLYSKLPVDYVNGLCRTRNMVYDEKDCLEVILASVFIDVLGSDSHITNWASLAEVITLLGNSDDYNLLLKELFSSGTEGFEIISRISSKIAPNSPFIMVGCKLYYTERRGL